MAVRRYIQNGWDISTVAPSKGKATDLKKLIMQSATKVTGAALNPLLFAGASVSLGVT